MTQSLHAIPFGAPLAQRYCMWSDRRLGIPQRRALQRSFRSLCIRRQWYLIACNVGEHRVQAVVGARSRPGAIHQALYRLCLGSRPSRTWDTTAPSPLFSEHEVIDACTRVLYEHTNGFFLDDDDDVLE